MHPSNSYPNSVNLEESEDEVKKFLLGNQDRIALLLVECRPFKSEQDRAAYVIRKLLEERKTKS